MKFNRRQFLRGLGVCVALPTLESLRPLSATAAAPGALATTATGAPLRSVFLYVPNGVIQDAWWPTGGGQDFTFGRTLAPLESWRKKIHILGGLDDKSALAEKDGGGDHARANATFLTGVRVKKSATDIQAGISIDQEMARRVGHLTRLPSLELSCESGRMSGVCDSGYSCAYQYNLSWTSPSTPAPAETNPHLAFERLFGAGPPGQRAAGYRARAAEQRSILDFVLDDARAMRRQLDAADAGKLDEYLTGVRELEARIQAAEHLGDPPDPKTPTPPSKPESSAQHISLMFDILALAFQTDSTRIATLALAHDGSNRSFGDIGISDGHHELTHHFGNTEKIAKVAQIDLWYVKQFARFLEKLDAVKDPDGQSVLHNSMVVYGSGCADGNAHSHVNLPIILAGGGGGTIQPGRFIKKSSVPLSNLFLAMGDRMGLGDLPRFADSTGRLQGI